MLRPVGHEERQREEARKDARHAGRVRGESTATQCGGVEPCRGAGEGPQRAGRDGGVRFAGEGGEQAGAADEGGEDADPRGEGVSADEKADREWVQDAADGGTRGGDADGDVALVREPLADKKDYIIDRT